MKPYINLLLTLFLTTILISGSTSLTHASNENCLTAGFWVEDGFYDFFDPTKNPNSKNTFEQWADNQMTKWNEILAKSGVNDCFRISKIVRVSDNSLPLRGYGPPGNYADTEDRSVDVIWGFPASDFQKPTQANYWKSVLNGVDFALLHELSHARYLIDEYALDFSAGNGLDQVDVVDPNGLPLVGNYFKLYSDRIYTNKSQDFMAGNYSFYAPHSVNAFNRISGQHYAEKYGNFNAPGNLGEYLNDLPENNILKILDNQHEPLANATVKIFQSIRGDSGATYAKKIDNSPDYIGITNNEGKIFIGHNPFGGEKIDPFASNELFLLGVFYQDQFFYKFIEVSDFNLAYWAGATNEATYVIRTNINESQKPKSIMLENQVKITCGSDKEPVSNIVVYLLPQGNDKLLAEGKTDEEGLLNMIYTINNPIASTEYHIIPNTVKVNGKIIRTETEDDFNIFIPDPPQNFTITKNFHYSECPNSTSPSPSPTPLASDNPEATDSADQGNSLASSSPTSQSQVTKIQISNYSDFRESNALDDFGSRTVTIDDPASYKQEGSGDSWDELRQRLVSVDWHLNTLSSDAYKKLYVRVFESDNYTDYQYLMENEEVTQVPFDDPLIAIRNQVDNKLIKATVIVNGQNIDIDLESGTQIHLEGDSSKDEDFDIAYEIEDAKEGVQRSAIKVVYRPGRAAASPASSSSSSPSPTATITGWECDYDEENSQFFIKENYSDGAWKIERVCDDQNGGRLCRALGKTPDGYPEGTSDAECYNNDTSSPTPSPTDGTSGKTLKGWWCVDSTHMYRQYSDGSREPDCTCGDNEGDCGGGTDATVCRNKDYSEVPAGYDVDAECIVPAVSSGSCYLGGDTDNNCVYSDSGQCYIGYTSDTENCNLTEDGVCFNPEAGCRYSCGPVACP